MKYLGFLFFTLIIAGCASTEKVQQLEMKVNDLNSKISQLADENQQYKDKLLDLIREIAAERSGIPSGEIMNLPIKKQKDSTDNKSVRQCKAISAKGTQCTRNAQAGSDYCWQHQGKNSSSSNNQSINSSREIFTGPRGGQYYINSKGKKTYIRKKK